MSARRAVRALAIFGALLLMLSIVRVPTAEAAPLHASLLSSEPAAGALLTAPPSRLRFVFSEPIEPALSALSFVVAPADAPSLVATGDPHDVHALIATPGVLAPGRYVVEWRALSADGHRVSGHVEFTIAGGAGVAAVSSATRAATRAPAPTSRERAPWAAAFAHDTRLDRLTRALRAAAITALLAVTGLALLIAVLPISGPRPLRVATGIAIVTVVSLAAYTVAWSIGAAGGGMNAVDAVMAATSTTPGALEVARLALALLALWALGLARRPGLAAALALVATVISGASGHPAVMSPVWTIPAKAIHLVAVALWLGGLIWLVTADRHGGRYVDGARRISTIALVAVLLVVATGIVQAALILPSVPALFRSAYGQLVLLKTAGLVVLVLFGAFHRRIVPRMETTMARRRLRRSVRAEIVVMLLVSALGGLLATVAPPR